LQRILLSVALLTLLPLAGFGQDPAPDLDEEKVEPRIVQFLPRVGAGQKVPCVLLGKTQFLEPPKGFETFCEKHAGRARKKLREEVMAGLKAVAGREQPRILEALGNPGSAKSLWIVNAIYVNLTPAEIGTASKLEIVRYVYPGQVYRGPPGASPPARTVGTVLEPGKREPFSAEGKTVPWNLEEIGADRVWKEMGVTGEGVVVAMLDAGVNYNHEDLRGNVWINAGEKPNNGKDDDGNGYVDDLYGFNFMTGSPEILPDPKARIQHGTLTSGILAGDGTGGTVTGVAPRARIMPLIGFGHFASFAFQYALEMGADVLNMSFSIPKLGHLRGFWRMMCDHAVCAGLVLVSGAGNFQQSQPIPVQMRIPEGVPSVVCAGGVDRERKVPPFCSLGPVEWASVKFYEDFPLKEDGTGGLVKPDVCGFPGPNYPVIWPRKGKGYIDPNKGIQGNSFSSPHVSGVAALVLCANRDLPAWRVKTILEETASDIDPPGKDPRTGAGLVNALEAVRKALVEKKGK